MCVATLVLCTNVENQIAAGGAVCNRSTSSGTDAQIERAGVLRGNIVLFNVYQAHVAEATVKSIESLRPESGPEIGLLYDTSICEEVPLLRCCLCALRA